MGKRILIAPLDWGLGHATRCIPIIRHLLDTGNEPVIAASGRSLNLLSSEFPDVETHHFAGYDINYPEGNRMAWKMLLSLPQMLRRIHEEEHELKPLITKLKLDGVISDNRFGLHTDQVPCVYMTHQVMIKAPFFESMLHRKHKSYMQRFTHVWIPDFEENGLSGDLSHKYPKPLNAQFIGPLSRFEAKDIALKTDVLVLISGPEPQRTVFERLVMEQLSGFSGTVTAVLGTPDKKSDTTETNLRMISHLNAAELQKEIASAKLIVTRSGYSSVMDMAAMGKKAVLIPTPGQTEQEYLAKFFDTRKQHLAVKQHGLDLLSAIKMTESYSGFNAQKFDGFKPAVDAFVSEL